MKITFSNRYHRQGFSFLEIMLISLLLMFAIVPLTSLLHRETKSTAMGKRRTFALNLASNIIERLKVENVEMLKINFSDESASADAISILPELNLPSEDPEFTRFKSSFERTAVVEVDPSSSGRKIKVTAIVRWDEDGHRRQVERAIVLVDAVFPSGRSQ